MQLAAHTPHPLTPCSCTCTMQSVHLDASHPSPPRSLRSGAVPGDLIPAVDLLALLEGRLASGLRSRSLSLSWHDVRTRSVEMLQGLQAAEVGDGGTVAFPGRLRPERLCAELGALAAGWHVVADDADVVVVDDASHAGPVPTGLIVVIDGPAAGQSIGLDRFAARGVAWAASHGVSPRPVPLIAARGIRTGDHVLARAACDRFVARSVLVAAAVAGTDLYVGETGADAVPELDRTGADVLASGADEVERIAAFAAGQRATAARTLRRVGRGPLGGRLRLVLVDRLPSAEACATLGRLGVAVATAG